jgi:uncharacterized protein
MKPRISMITLYFSDPDGYLWEVAHNPLFWVGPADARA